MSARLARISGIAAVLLVFALVASCTVSTGVGGAPASVSFTLLGRTVTITFGSVGRVQAVKDQTVTQSGVVRLFDETPTARPPTGTMRLLGSSVSTDGPISAKSAARSQTGGPVNGTATVRFFIGPGESATACTTGTLLASYDLSVVAGIVSVLDDVAELSASALDAVMVNDVTICVEVTANFSGLIVFEEFSFTFGGGEEGTASFTLVNNDSENIHILLPGEVFNDAENRITPGSVRNATMEVSVGDDITLRAGRGGTILSTATCPTVTGSNYTATGTWNGIEVVCEAEQSDDGGGGSTPPTGSSLQVPIDSPDGVAVAVPPTESYNGIDYAIVGVLGDNTLEAPISPYPLLVTIDLSTLGLASVEQMHMAVVSAFVPDIPNGVTLATLTCSYEEGGSPTTMDFTLGSTTAEWSFLRPEHASIGGVAHDSIPVLYSFPTTVDSASEYDGWVYDVSLAMDASRTLSSCTLTATSASTFPPRPLVPEPTWAATSILGLTLVGPAGTPGASGGGGDDGAGTAMGQVVDAQTGAPLAGVTIRVTGTTLSTTTDASGNYSLSGVPAGGQTLEASFSGYVDTTTTILVLDGATSETSIGMLAIGAGGDNVAVILSWGQDPRDLDLHMSGPDGGGGRFHAYFSSKQPVPHAFLDLDDTTSFGPETMTVSPVDGGAFVAGDYNIWVHHFAGESTLGQSSATVTLFAGGTQIAQYSVSSGSGDSSQVIWRVVEFTVNADGSVSNINVLQSFDDGSAGTEF